MNKNKPSKKIRVLLLTFSLSKGGAEKVVSQLNCNFSQNIESLIVTISDDISYPYKKQIISLKENEFKPDILFLPYIFIISIIKYRKILRYYKPDISMSFLMLPNIINIISCFDKSKINVIITIHSILSLKMKRNSFFKFGGIIAKKIYGCSNKTIVPSTNIKNEITSLFRLKNDDIIIIKNPVDLNNINQMMNETVDDMWFKDEVPYFINVGRLEEPKGQWHLIRSFYNVRKKMKCKLIICGDGSLRNYLSDLIRTLQLNDDVRLLGWVDNPYKFMKMADIFLFSSLYENFPLVLLEAMACGCPIISTDCIYGPKLILENGKFGILVPPFNGVQYQAWDELTKSEIYYSNMISQLIENKKALHEFEKKGIEKIHDYNITEIIKIYENLFYYLVGENK